MTKLVLSQRVPFKYDRATWLDIVNRLEQQVNQLAEGRIEARHDARDVKPTTGVFGQGDILWNLEPSTGEPWMWRCVTSGSPGTIEADRKRGTFTMDADASTTVTDDDCTADSVIVLMPTNAAAATLLAGASAPYITPGAGTFDVDTADGGNAAGTETFTYLILN